MSAFACYERCEMFDDSSCGLDRASLRNLPATTRAGLSAIRNRVMALFELMVDVMVSSELRHNIRSHAFC